MSLNISLLEAIAMLFALDVFALHVFTLKTLLLPVEFKIDVAGYCCNRELLGSQFHNFLFDVVVGDAFELWVLLEVFGDNLVSKLGQ